MVWGDGPSVPYDIAIVASMLFGRFEEKLAVVATVSVPPSGMLVCTACLAAACSTGRPLLTMPAPLDAVPGADGC